MLNKLFKLIGVNSNRTKNITKHISLSFVYKGGSILANFLLVPLTINFLDTTNYGIWLLITSFVGWFAFFDVGLGHGLRNKFAESKAKNDHKHIKSLISSAYFTLFFVCLLLTFFFIGINFFVDWTVIFNTEKRLYEDLSLLMLVVFSCFCFQLVAKLITSIYTADQKPSNQDLINFLTQLISLLVIYLATQFLNSSLLLFGVLFSVIPLLILIIFNLVSFSREYKEYKPSFILCKKKYIKEIFGLGFKFFVIQIAGVVIYSTDNIIITQLFGPDEVVPYNLAFKYFSIITLGFSIIVTPYWSAITEAYTKNEMDWIKKSMKNLTLIAIGFVLVTILFIVFSNWFYQVWIGKQITVPILLSSLMGLYVSIQVLMTPVLYFINGTGKVKLQQNILVLMAIINIPLSIVLARNFEIGSSGVILATIICLVPVLFFTKIQYSKILKGTTKGIWNA